MTDDETAKRIVMVAAELYVKLPLTSRGIEAGVEVLGTLIDAMRDAYVLGIQRSTEIVREHLGPAGTTPEPALPS